MGNDPINLTDPSGLGPRHMLWWQRGTGSLFGTRPWGQNSLWRMQVAGREWEEFMEKTREEARDALREINAAKRRAVAEGCDSNTRQALVSLAFDLTGAKLLGVIAHAGRARVLATSAGSYAREAARLRSLGDEINAAPRDFAGSRVLAAAQQQSELVWTALGVKMYQLSEFDWATASTGPWTATYEGSKLIPGWGTGFELGEALKSCLR